MRHIKILFALALSVLAVSPALYAQDASSVQKQAKKKQNKEIKKRTWCKKAQKSGKCCCARFEEKNAYHKDAYRDALSGADLDEWAETREEETAEKIIADHMQDMAQRMEDRADRMEKAAERMGRHAEKAVEVDIRLGEDIEVEMDRIAERIEEELDLHGEEIAEHIEDVADRMEGIAERMLEELYNSLRESRSFEDKK